MFDPWPGNFHMQSVCVCVGGGVRGRAIRKVQIKTMMKYLFTPTKRTIIKKDRKYQAVVR